MKGRGRGTDRLSHQIILRRSFGRKTGKDQLGKPYQGRRNLFITLHGLKKSSNPNNSLLVLRGKNY
jgi:hypothetical protein